MKPDLSTAVSAVLALITNSPGLSLSPFALFHAATSALLVLVALVFVGHGIAALQDAEVLPFSRVQVTAVPQLGIHPSLQGLAAQALVVVLIAIGFLLNRRQRSR